LLVLALHGLEVFSKRFHDRRRQHSIAVLVAFAGSNYDLVLRKVDIFDP
jgi:hypothetical protein